MYSILCSYDELSTERELNEIKNHLMQGMKIYWFTTISLESVEQEYTLNKAFKSGILRMYDKKEMNLDSFFFKDGEDVPEELLQKLDEGTTFNKNQYLIEHNQHPYLSVKAGAGTGKTTVLLDYLMYVKHSQSDFNYAKAAMITFTREAAVHLRKKVEQRLFDYYDLTADQKYLEWADEVKQMNMGTIHSFARTILKSEGLSIGWIKNVSIRSFHLDKKRLIIKYIDQFASQNPSVFEAFKRIPHYLLVKSIQEIINVLENKALPYGEHDNIDFGVDHEKSDQLVKYVVNHVYEELQQMKRESQEMELSDLVTELRNFDANEARLKETTLTHILVDEFQDTDEVQVKFLSWLLDQTQAQLFIVGDIKQSIYRFRGADYTAFQQMKDSLIGKGLSLVEIPLVKNYRSDSHLLTQFDNMFREWDESVNAFTYSESDQLKATKEEGNSIGLAKVTLDDADLKIILDRVKSDDTAILVRTNQDVKDTIQRCESLGVFCENRQTGTYYRSLPVREFYMFIRAFTHPTDWVNRYALHQSSYYKEKLNNFDIVNQYSAEKLFMNQFFEDDWVNQMRDRVLMDHSILSTLEECIKDRDPSNQYRIDFYRQSCAKTEEANPEAIKEEAILRMKEYQLNLDKLIHILRQIFPHQSASLLQIEKFLRVKMAEDRFEDKLYLPIEDTNRIKVMTVHKSKGLEFNHVLLIRNDHTFLRRFGTRVFVMNKDNTWKIAYHIQMGQTSFRNQYMSHLVGEDNSEVIGEETRLLYVALTRAKKEVYADVRSQNSGGAVNSWADLLKKGGVEHVSN
ncbi:ATP-dependent helicase [Alkalihalophilus marmarensis]|uniref:ATP-dependent helicase n=1 Tax=Alkalihalophilus marmarensis TaxID=521377 RepID=UPI002DBDD4B0|nr:ATP-dependent helicase [Alkalihalophilus marmarensis]MEC2072487.1 ATP-dependent helicase [Alkalihalophilus marmarensis]